MPHNTLVYIVYIICYPDPDMALPLDSDSHFPFSSALLETAPPTLEEFAPLASSQPTPQSMGEQAPCEHAVPSRQHQVPLVTPYSFAQVGAPGRVDWLEAGLHITDIGGWCLENMTSFYRCFRCKTQN